MKTGRREKGKGRSRGFTLIELLLVISIISLLSTGLFYNVTEAKKKAEDAQMKIESSSVRNAIELYKEDHGGKVPSTSIKGKMVREGDPDNDDYEETMNQLVTGGYLPEIPTSPSGEAYAYMVSEDELQAVFAASLNFEENNSEDGVSRNSCDLTTYEQTEWFENCESRYGVSDENGLILFGSFSNASCTDEEYDPETQACFSTKFSSVVGKCVCDIQNGSYSKDPSTFPDYICSQVIVPGVQPGTCGGNMFAPPLYVCDLVQPPTLGEQACDGGSGTDYCTCI